MAPTILQEPNAMWSGARLTLLNKRVGALLQEMDKLSGAQVAWVCDVRGTTLALWYATTALPRATTDRVSACLANLFAAFPPHSFREIEILFEDRLVYGRTLGKAWLAVVCAPNTSLALIRMTCNVAAVPFETDKELQGYLGSTPKPNIEMRLG